MPQTNLQLKNVNKSEEQSDDYTNTEEKAHLH